MKHTLLFTLLLCSAAPLHAAEVYHPTIHMKNGIEVFEAVVSERTPEKVHKMTDAEYYRYAKKHNKKALYENRRAAIAQDGHMRYANVNEGAYASQTRFGGGVGYGGFGGSGGYAGYLGAADQQNGNGGGGFGGYRYGAGRPGNSMQTAGRSYSKSYTLEIKPWPTFNGGDVELLNPYVKPSHAND